MKMDLGGEIFKENEGYPRGLADVMERAGPPRGGNPPPPPGSTEGGLGLIWLWLGGVGKFGHAFRDTGGGKVGHGEDFLVKISPRRV